MTFMLAESAGSGGMSMGVWAIYIVGIVVFMYFFTIRPQNKSKKQHEELVASVAVGDSILTSSGFYGVIIDLTDDTAIVEFGNNKNCRIPMKKSEIVDIEKPE